MDGLPIQDVRMFQDALYHGPTPVVLIAPGPPDDFTKMFPGLPPFAACAQPFIGRVRELGRRTG